MKQIWIDDQGFGVVPLGRWAPLWSDKVIIAASLLQSSTINWSSCERNGSREASPAERSQFKDNEWTYVKTVPEVDHDGDVDDENTFMSISHFTW